MLKFKREELVDKKLSQLMESKGFDEKKANEIFSLIEKDIEEALKKTLKRS
jgi:hypothetical protein